MAQMGAGKDDDDGRPGCARAGADAYPPWTLDRPMGSNSQEQAQLQHKQRLRKRHESVTSYFEERDLSERGPSNGCSRLNQA